ncbi:pancreatic triacylglycerol lipase-like [Colletes gigas]|uniref:pancreatic triacylglycerol lipase-like n=1 Tax=Colletes gigas TaxID=935657 RepID=UPI001C9BBAE5|nr:pancreatic triacylglycerol lipase-like [Colletes gigas]
MKAYFVSSLVLVCSIGGWSLFNNVVDGASCTGNKGYLASTANLNSEVGMYDDEGNVVPIKNKDLDIAEPKAVPLEQVAKGVIFYLYTRSTVNNPDVLVVNDVERLKKSQFSISRPTKFIIHGWLGSRQSRPLIGLRDALLQNGDFNVILVDWGLMARSPYRIASTCVVGVAKQVTSMIDFLETQGMDVSPLMLIGHSLGAHVVGLAARHAKTKPKFVIGLDPALPYFSIANTENRIARGDGHYVLILHTNSGVLGFDLPLGDADFYFNGGTVQRGCEVDPTSACSHFRATLFYAEALNSANGFWGTKCDNYNNYRAGRCTEPKVLMGGIEPDTSITGVYYLDTTAVSPYALGR